MKYELGNLVFHYAKDVSFVLSMLIPMFLFGIFFEKRNHILVRILLLSVTYLIIIFGLTALDASEILAETIEDALEYVLLSFMVLGALPLCYKTKILHYVFADFCSINVAMIARSLRAIVIFLLYQEDYQNLSSSHRLVYELLEYAFVFLLCLVVYFVIIRILKKYGDFYVSPQSAVLYVFSCIIHSALNSVANQFMSQSSNIWITMNLCLIGFSALFIYMQLVIIDQGYKQSQLVMKNRLIANMEEQYHHSEEVTQALNIKYHDLKHVMNLLKKEDAGKYQEEIHTALDSYAALVETGNHTLDVILTEKALSCKQNGIEMTCDIDGMKLSFMDDYDLYSFFFNALDNAIQYLKTIPEKENRFLIIQQTNINGMLTLTIENYCKETLQFQDGLPVTTKENQLYHGFGVKSMKETIEKYHGIFAVCQEDNLYVLKAIFTEKVN